MDDAAEVAKLAFRLTTDSLWATPFTELQTRRVLAEVALSRGDAKTAHAELDRARQLSLDGDNLIHHGWICWQLGRTAWMEGKRDDARGHFYDARKHLASIGNEGALRVVRATVHQLENPEVGRRASNVPAPASDITLPTATFVSMDHRKSAGTT